MSVLTSNAESAAGARAAARLTPTEKRLWNALRRQRGRVYSRAELITVAMPGTIVSPRTVDVHIRSLRRKLGALANPIHTVRRVGYCFGPPALNRSPSP
jgi:DNA-binding response OmpR family regulator